MSQEPIPLPPEHRDTLEPLAPDVLESMFTTIAASTVDAAPSPRESLRALPTPQRVIAAAVTSLAAAALYVLLMGIRMDLTGADLVQFIVASSALALLGVVATVLGMRSLHAAPIPQIGAIAAIVLALPALSALVPGLWTGFLPTEPVAAEVHLNCGLASLCITVVTTFAILYIDRSDRPPLWRFALAAAAGGLFGFVASGLHCPMVSVFHLVVAHGFSGLAVGAGLAAWSSLR